MEARKEQLDGENQDLRLAKEALSVDIARVRKEREIEEGRLNRQIEALEQKMTAANRDHEVFTLRLFEPAGSSLRNSEMEQFTRTRS